jgi:secretion/DNA translocation related CpaE-like protein
MSQPVLVITRDAALASALDRLAAAAGATTDLVAGPGPALERWPHCRTVLLGLDCLAEAAAVAPPRRPGVVVVSATDVPDAAFRDALVVSAESVVELPAAEDWLVEVLAHDAEGRAPAVTLGVVGGSGGVGASTMATVLAAVAAAADADGRAPAAVLLDFDPWGAGLEHLLGVNEPDEPVPSHADWSRLAESTGRLGSDAVCRALPVHRGVGLLGWGGTRRTGVPPVAVREVWDAVRRGVPFVVADLPRHPTPMSGEVLHRCDAVVLVTGASVTSVAASAQVARSLPAGVPVRLVVRRQRSGLSEGRVAAALGFELAAVLDRDRRWEEAVALGLGPPTSRRSPLARAAGEVLDRLALRTGASRAR